MPAPFQGQTCERIVVSNRMTVPSGARPPSFVDSLGFGVMCCDEAGLVCYANAEAEYILGAAMDQMAGSPLLHGFKWELGRRDGATVEGSDSLTRQLLRRGRAKREVLLSVRRPGHSRKWIKGTLTSAEHGLMFSFIDVTRYRRAQRALQDQLHDSLTALPNRALLNDRLHHATAIASRSAGGLGLMLIDIDGFKEVNLAFGHKAGDEMLNKIGARLQETVRNADSVCRIAGDEFAVLLWGITSEATATYTANRILRALEQPFQLRGQAVELFASAGLAMYPRHGNSPKELTSGAYAAMYAAKREHVGCLVYDDEYGTANTPNRMSLRSELRKAIAEDELVLYYQPKVAYSPHETPCVEALVRWMHPTRGLVPPDDFIPLAEDSGLIRPLGDWVLNTGLRQCRLWLDAGTPVGVAVNLSMHNLQDPGLLETIKSLLVKWNVPPPLLKLEVTESSIASHPERVLEVLMELQALGIGMSIDDFGTGFSSLMQLRKLPVSEIKIDKSFVQGMLQNDNDGVIVRTTIDLGHNLGLLVVAEGVEDEQMWSSLQAYGCDVAQGYYMAKPMPADQLNAWLHDSAWAPYVEREPVLLSA